MQIESLLSGLYLIKPKVFEDHRGHFFESFREDVLKDNGVETKFFQDNQSLSQKGILRGLHFQAPPFSQGKFVRVIKGAVLDVALDAGILTQKGAWIYYNGELFAQGRENAINHLRENEDTFLDMKEKIKAISN